MSKAERFFTHPIGILVGAITATFLWGSAFPFIKYSYDLLEIAPHEIGEQIIFAGYRFFLAAIGIYFCIIIFQKKKSIIKANYKDLLVIGFFQTFFQYILFYIGLSLSTGIKGSIIAGTGSFFQILFAHFMYSDDKLSWRKTIGMTVGFSGVIIINLRNGTFEMDFGLGEALLLASMVSSAFGNILSKKGSVKMDVIQLTCFQMLFGSIGLLLVGITFTGFLPFEFSILSFAILLYLSFLSAAGFIIWNQVMKYNQVGKVSIFLFLIPVFGVFLSNMILGEVIHLFVFLGLFLVITGILIVSRRKKEGLKEV